MPILHVTQAHVRSEHIYTHEIWYRSQLGFAPDMDRLGGRCSNHLMHACKDTSILVAVFAFIFLLAFVSF